MINRPTTVLRNSLAVLLLSASIAMAQPSGASAGIPRDTSYTSYSATIKLLKKYPSVRLVKPQLPPGVSEKKGVCYAAYGARRLHLDVFYPTNRVRLYPGILMIHGGGWSSGNRSMLVPMAERLASHGFVAVTPEYRLSPEVHFPAAVYDLKAAVRWMRANASVYGIDTSAIAAYGCSAGGELAAFLGTTGAVKKFEGHGGYLSHSGSVQAVVDVDGLLDFMNINSTKYDNNPQKPSAAHRWFGGSYKKIPQVWKEASPITYVGKTTPPFLFINSSMPHYHAGRDSMIGKMRNHGIYCKVYTIPGTPHTFWLFRPWFGKTLRYTVSFLNRTFGNPEKGASDGAN